ncbi:hypothetical protein POJ06DRAFT_99504 [Lipomyces tetrasporus]|uniref:Uncharacterized protein n=1 Tax=Lipomyces tetrasporus TaxID=54092 RepID=A0AAD7QUD5_9ASCO|nr:uncharacterized protein POJ06DRAFT_99504 [Lipomyces tetrasporus]KAJ8101614.1 hypothetical protein POJ06DRAFT_99504 [Lipomyces tetrasporus]
MIVTVESVLRSIYELVEKYKELKVVDVESRLFSRLCARWNRGSNNVSVENDQGDKENVNSRRFCKDWSEELPARSLSAQIAESGAASAAEAGDNLAKEFYLSSAVVEGVMIAVNAATAAMLGIELKDEWDHVDDSIRALDAINLIVECTQITGAVSVTLMVVGAEFSVLQRPDSWSRQPVLYLWKCVEHSSLQSLIVEYSSNV